MSPSERALVLVGPMGAGKTSIGRRVARALGERFVDTDAMIANEHGPIPELFAARGEAHFRAIEHEVVARAVAEGGVVSLGGGAVLDAGTRRTLADHDVVFLTVRAGVIAGRIAGGNRPLLVGGDPVEKWKRVFDERRALYEEVADVVVDTSNGPLSQVVATICDWARNERPRRSGEQEHA